MSARDDRLAELLGQRHLRGCSGEDPGAPASDLRLEASDLQSPIIEPQRDEHGETVDALVGYRDHVAIQCLTCSGRRVIPDATVAQLIDAPIAEARS